MITLGIDTDHAINSSHDPRNRVYVQKQRGVKTFARTQKGCQKENMEKMKALKTTKKEFTAGKGEKGNSKLLAQVSSRTQVK